MMADVEFSHDVGPYGHDGADPAGAHSVMSWTNTAGAIVSLALIAGIGVWGYELMMRDVNGIPVVRATGTELRVRPEDPGGQLAEHQGLAVNEIAAQGAASGPVDRVVLAPPAVALAEEDQPVLVKAAPILQPAPLQSAETAFAAQPEDAISGTATAPAELEQSAQGQGSEIDALVAELMADSGTAAPADGPKVVQARAATPYLKPEPAVLRDDAAASDIPPGLAVSVRPRLRPANAPLTPRQVAYTPAAETREIDPDAIPSGTRLAQLGAFESPEVARSEWQKMQNRFGDILEGKSRVVQKAESGGRTFYRLRAMGFVDLSDARRFCSAVKAEGVDCIPVQVR
jgi:hypothetical protein